MLRQFEIADLHNHAQRYALLALNNESARETSVLTSQRFEKLIDVARVALFIPPAAALLLAFEDSDHYDGGHFQWFRSRLDKFLYIDRIVVAAAWRRRGLARLLYGEVFRRGICLGHTHIVCEVNVQPPNPVSDDFHAALGFEELGRATINNGTKAVRYLQAIL